MNEFEAMFPDVPVSGTAQRHWSRENQALLYDACRKIERFDANPWCFTADMRHFEQFAGHPERTAWSYMTDLERETLIHDYN